MCEAVGARKQEMKRRRGGGVVVAHTSIKRVNKTRQKFSAESKLRRWTETLPGRGLVVYVPGSE